MMSTQVSYTPIQQQQQDESSWTNMIAAQSIAAEPSIVHSSAPNNQLKQYQSDDQQSIRNKCVANNQIPVNDEQTNQQRYNFQFQDEMSRMRERLFRLLSKVPIHVETEPVPSCSSSSAETSCSMPSASTSRPTVRSSRSSSQQSKVIGREPLIIKYYKDRTLPELIEQHFGCSLIKHNYNHREPLMRGMDLIFNCSNRSNIHHPDQQQQQQAATNYTSRSNSSFGAQAKSETSQRIRKPSYNEQQAVWPMTQNSTSSSSSSSMSSSSVGQLKSWHHLSMDNTRVGWKSASTKTPISNQNARNQLKRNGSTNASHSKGKGAKNHYQAAVEPVSTFTNYPQHNLEASAAAYQQSANIDTTIEARYEQQPILLVSRFDGQPFVDNSGSCWQPSSLDSQPVNDVIQQQQQQHYAECYYQPLTQPQVLQGCFDTWQNTEVESRLIEQQQQQLTTISSETNEFNSPTALYLPFSATNHNHNHNQHQHNLSGTPFYPSQPFSQPPAHHQLEAHDNQLIQYQPQHSIQQVAPEQASCPVIFTEPVYLSNSSSAGSI